MRLYPLLLILMWTISASTDSATLPGIALIDLRTVSNQNLDIIKRNPEVTWWAELGKTMLVGGASRHILAFGPPVLRHWTHLKSDQLSVIRAGHPHELPRHMSILATAGRLTIVAGVQPDDIAATQANGHQKIEPFQRNHVYVRAGFRDTPQKKWGHTQQLAALSAIDSVDPVRWYGDVGTLTNWNRHVSSVDVVSARDWLKEQLDLLKPTSSVLQKFNLGGRDAWNVVASFEGPLDSDVYVISGHYDSLSENVSRSAPGAEDNASGAAGVLELARIFAVRERKATLIFIAFSGEEEGLIGSKAYVNSLPASMRSRIKGALNMDMIGYTQDGSLGVLIETSPNFRELHDHFAIAARLVDGLETYSSFSPFGSDHVPFINKNIPALLTCDNDWGEYPDYHRTTDTIEKLSREMGAAILKMNAAALAAILE